MFALLAVPVAIYVVYAAVSGEIWVKQGPWGRRVARKENPVYFWTSVAIYAGLAIALATVL
jgi:hypothetical protein